MASSSAAALAFDTAPPGWRLPEPGTLVGDRYELRELLGEGGMSAVYSAHDRRLHRSVAFKLLTPRLAHSKDIITRFVNEARTLARLDCPHIVQVFDAGSTAAPGGLSLPFMVLELLKGAELRSVVEEGNYDDGRVIGWMLDACEGLAAAHAEGVVHRDLKPENLFLVCEPDGSERIKILDFGVARSVELVQQLTFAGEGVGSPGYMSPEQVRDASSADARSDIWSLGVVMYELFAREPPFCAQSPLELCSMILNAPIVPLGELRPDLPHELAAIVDRCLQRDADRRFANVLELAEALAPFARPSGSVATARIRRRLHADSGAFPRPRESYGAPVAYVEPPRRPGQHANDSRALAGSSSLDDDSSSLDDDSSSLDDDSSSLDDDSSSLDESAPPQVSRSLWKRRALRRMWLARALGLFLLSGVLALLVIAFVPGAAAQSRAFVAEQSGRLVHAARSLLNPQ